MARSAKKSAFLSNLLLKSPILFLFQTICIIGCSFQLVSIVSEFLRFNIVVEIEVDSNDYTYLPAITISNDFFMFLNQTKINQEFKEWANLSTLQKTRKFLSLQNITSSYKFKFLYDKNVLFENCSVYDIYSPNFTREQIENYERLSDEYKTNIVNKNEFANINLSISEFNPPYVTRKCLDVSSIYLRTEYKNLSGWSNHLFYLTLFYRPDNQINNNRFKFTKMSNELLISLKWELLVTEGRLISLSE